MRENLMPNGATKADYNLSLAHLKTSTSKTADASKALALREKGNALYKSQKYIKAIEMYTQSIACVSDISTHGNRCQCYINLIKESRAKNEYNR
jgi:hypothetical protein